eukprot:scaffold16485_cov140-Isochrysis_galbana.AAC.1
MDRRPLQSLFAGKKPLARATNHSLLGVINALRGLKACRAPGGGLNSSSSGRREGFLIFDVDVRSRHHLGIAPIISGRESDRTARDSQCSAESPLECSVLYLRFFVMCARRHHGGARRVRCAARAKRPNPPPSHNILITHRETLWPGSAAAHSNVPRGAPWPARGGRRMSVGGQPVESHLSVDLWISDPAVRAAGHAL